MPTLTLTPALADAIAAGVERGLPVETAARLASVSKSTLYQWLNSTSGTWSHQGTPVSQSTQAALRYLESAIADAQAKWEAKRVALVTAAAESAEQKDAWRANAWLLEHLPATKERYADYKQVSVHQTHEISPAHTIVKELGDDELRALASGGDDRGLDRSGVAE